MSEIEERILGLPEITDGQLIDILVDLSDEVTARGARAAPDSRHYQWAAHCIDEATEAIKQQVREDS